MADNIRITIRKYGIGGFEKNFQGKATTKFVVSKFRQAKRIGADEVTVRFL